MKKWVCRFTERVAAKSVWSKSIKFRIVAVVTYGGKIVSIGHNRQQSCHDRNIHAEMSATFGIKHNIEGSSIYVCRITTNGLSMARPCKDCLDSLIRSKVKSVCYTNYDGEWQEEII